MPVSQGYTVEAQLKGKDMFSGMQIEITPTRRRAITSSYQIFITTLSGKTVTVPCGAIIALNFVEAEEGPAPDSQWYIFAGRQLGNDGMTLEQYGVHPSTWHLLVRLRGGNPNYQLGIAPGGLINQQVQADYYNPKDWLRGLTFSFPVHILNSEAFRAITGMNPPPSPIGAKTYRQAGLPLFKFYKEEKSRIFGFESFDALESVNRLEKERGLVDDVKPSVQPGRVIAIYDGPHQFLALQDGQYGEDIVQVHNPDGVLSPTGPHREVRTLADLEAEMDKLCIQPWSG
ncbi:hypothetical protein SLS53_008840 [Cytospora paraplurivora]|uniref:Ubiquitin-like domain-containing protein n=1 Tax=Cytospora paraplurivora TaxID=2898453 RepID=A0AAN9TZT1_9PEZI